MAQSPTQALILGPPEIMTGDEIKNWTPNRLSHPAPLTPILSMKTLFYSTHPSCLTIYCGELWKQEM